MKYRMWKLTDSYGSTRNSPQARQTGFLGSDSCAEVSRQLECQERTLAMHTQKKQAWPQNKLWIFLGQLCVCKISDQTGKCQDFHIQNLITGARCGLISRIPTTWTCIRSRSLNNRSCPGLPGVSPIDCLDAICMGVQLQFQNCVQSFLVEESWSSVNLEIGYRLIREATHEISL